MARAHFCGTVSVNQRDPRPRQGASSPTLIHLTKASEAVGVGFRLSPDSRPQIFPRIVYCKSLGEISRSCHFHSCAVPRWYQRPLVNSSFRHSPEYVFFTTTSNMAANMPLLRH